MKTGSSSRRRSREIRADLHAAGITDQQIEPVREGMRRVVADRHRQEGADQGHHRRRQDGHRAVLARKDGKTVKERQPHLVHHLRALRRAEIRDLRHGAGREIRRRRLRADRAEDHGGKPRAGEGLRPRPASARTRRSAASPRSNWSITRRASCPTDQQPDEETADHTDMRRQEAVGRANDRPTRHPRRRRRPGRPQWPAWCACAADARSRSAIFSSASSAQIQRRPSSHRPSSRQTNPAGWSLILHHPSAHQTLPQTHFP